MTGYLERLGGYTCPPHIQTRDERTPNSHESIEFRNLLAAFRDEFTLKPLRPVAEFVPLLRKWHQTKRDEAVAAGGKVMVLKHPLSAFFVPQLAELEGASFVVITRRFAEIEKTRERRNWLAVYGAEGARAVYSALMSGLIEAEVSFEAIAFREFLKDSAARERFRANLPPGLRDADPDAAENWLRS